jgi:hypothetical protein
VDPNLAIVAALLINSTEMIRLFVAVALTFTTLAPTLASACGGFFCSVPTGPTPPQPVDQTAERIVFEVHGDDTITAHVQISYAGPADEFAWIVPVPGTPDVSETDPVMFQDIDATTALQVLLPSPEFCPITNGGGGRAGCGGCASMDTAMEGTSTATASGDDSRAGPVVVVHAEGSTDNYDYVVISADLASDLTEWLQGEGYNVSDNMVPVMQPYVDDGMRYLAVRLRDGRTANDVAPLAMRYEGDEPMIPIQLTAVAAQPLMGVQVWIFGEAPYLPENYSWEVPATQEIFSDELGNTSYFAWVARIVSESDGQTWSAEYIGQNLTGRFPQHEIVSRFYTRLSPEQMTVDPTFAVSAAPSVSNFLDLSGQPTPFGCNGINFSVLPSLCAYNYCGPGASCSVIDDRVACKCADGDVAQDITNPDGSDGVTCVPSNNPFGITAAAGGAGTEFDPCNEMDCGAGVCVLRNGFPTCDCAESAFACLEDDGTIFCVEPPEEPTTFGPGAGSESAPVIAAKETEPGLVRFAGLPWVPAILVLGAVAVTRPRSLRRRN